MADEENSVTLTTTASTQMDIKLNHSQSVVSEDSTNKKSVVVSKAQNHLVEVAKTLKQDKKVKSAEDKLLEHRDNSRKQLKNIKAYLNAIKTGHKTYTPRVSTTQVQSKGWSLF